MSHSRANKFSSSLGFIAAASGAAIGLSNIWKFPYEVGNNGGALYLLIYTFFVVILGFPLVFIKALFGSITQKGVYGSYKENKKWEILGIFSVLVCVGVLSFYNVVTGWILGYAIKSIKGTLFNNQDYELLFSNFIKDIPLNSLYHLIITFTVIYIVKKGILKGIEKFSKLLMPILVILLIFLAFYSCTLKGALEGIKFYLLPTFSTFHLKSLSSALAHSFLSLALGGGVMITYGAYTTNKSNLARDSFIIVVSDFLIAFIAGLIIFPLIFHIGIKPNEGPSLIFVSIPYVLKSLGKYQGIFIGFLFFILLIFAAITSAISMLEIPIKYFLERFNISRKKATLYIGIFAYFLGIPSLLSHGGLSFFTNFLHLNQTSMSFMNVVIFLIVQIIMPLNALLFSIFISQNWKKYDINNRIQNYVKSEFFLKYIYFAIKFIAPISIGTIILLNFY